MKHFAKAAAFVLVFAASSAFAHHPAADIVDEDIYEMIDANVADTPHADLTFDAMGSASSVSANTMDSVTTSLDTVSRPVTVTRPTVTFSRVSGGR